jgi:uncharacterized protein YndB with AHSA1/START domain
MVFKAWTDPDALKKWFSPSGKWEMAVSALDVRVGGKYKFELVSNDSNKWIVSGEYKEIIPNSKISFTWTTEDVKATLVTVAFKQTGDLTEVSVHHDLLPNQEQVEEHKWGWNGCLDNLSGRMFR